MKSDQVRNNIHKTIQGEFNTDLITNPRNNKPQGNLDRNDKPKDLLP